MKNEPKKSPTGDIFVAFAAAPLKSFNSIRKKKRGSQTEMISLRYAYTYYTNKNLKGRFFEALF